MIVDAQYEQDERVLAPANEVTDLETPIPASESVAVIEAHGLRKKYCRNLRSSLAYGIRDVAEAMLLRSARPDALRRDEFWAVDQISFTVQRGESLGVIGHNGAGKSTLLKLITGQRSLTSGKVVTRGRVVALTELGLGFDPALTGRENAYINAAIFGLSRRDLEPMMPKIIAFSELEEFIDSAVQTYSSGMRARLAFAVAAHLDPDILIVDEVLAVGDLQFRRKCIEHVIGYLNRGGSLLLVSHDPYMVQTMCRRVLVLEKGRVIFDGDAVEGVNLHFEMGHAKKFQQKAGTCTAARPSQGDAQTSGNDGLSGMAMPGEVAYLAGESLPPLSDQNPVMIDRFEMVPAEGSMLTTTCQAIVRLYCRSLITTPVVWGFSFCTPDLLVNIAFCGGLDAPKPLMRVGQNVFTCRIPKLPLRPGVYAIRGGLGNGATMTPIAARGYENSPDFFTVKAEGASRSMNVQMAMNDLVEIPVEWLDRSATAEPD